jgi:putative hydrolase of the HAD superfamily
MIGTIVFDAGGVVLQGSFRDFLRRAKDYLGKEKFNLDASDVYFDENYNKGLISVDECFRKVFGDLSDDDLNMIKGFWGSTWMLSDEFRDLLVKLRRAGYRIAMLSNSDEYNSGLNVRKGVYSYFDEVVLSHEVHILKPEMAIYEFLLDRLGVSAQSCVFVDDVVCNLEPAIKLGMKTILFRDIGDLRDKFDYLGIKYD